MLFDSTRTAVNYLLNLDFTLGGSKLTKVGMIPKVTATGTLGPSAITDNGATISLTEPESIDIGAAPQTDQLGIKANALGFAGLFCGGQDNSKLDFDVERVAGVAIARHGSVVAVRKAVGKLTWLGSTGNTINSPVLVFNTLGTLDLSNGRWGFGNVAAPAYSVDAELDVNAGGVYRVAGTQVVGPRLAAIGAPSISTSNTASTANATYAANEQGMLNALKTAMGQANTDIANLQATVNSLRAALTSHGLTG